MEDLENQYKNELKAMTEKNASEISEINTTFE